MGTTADLDCRVAVVQISDFRLDREAALDGIEAVDEGAPGVDFVLNAQGRGAFGPGLLGLLREWTGGYATAIVLCMALQATAAATVLVRPPPGQQVSRT